jgi:hypothetical protein
LTVETNKYMEAGSKTYCSKAYYKPLAILINERIAFSKKVETPSGHLFILDFLRTVRPKRKFPVRIRWNIDTKGYNAEILPLFQ